jgi:exoribonuclease R
VRAPGAAAAASRSAGRALPATGEGAVKRGAIDFETVETRMIFDDHGKIERIEPYERNDAHRLIEECMLAANVCASEFLREREHPVAVSHP